MKSIDETVLGDPDVNKEAAEKEEKEQKFEGKPDDFLVHGYQSEGTEQEEESEAADSEVKEDTWTECERQTDWTSISNRPSGLPVCKTVLVITVHMGGQSYDLYDSRRALSN